MIIVGFKNMVLDTHRCIYTYVHLSIYAHIRGFYGNP